MAGDWLKIEAVTPDKPEVLEMAMELNIDPDAVFGKLFRVWTWFDSHSEDGNAPSVTEMLLDRQVGVTGFVTSMINVGWMHKSDDGLTIPNFDTHNGKSAKKRANTARRVAKLRNGNDKSNDDVTPEELQKALAREEKRREENKEKDKKKNSTLKTYLENCENEKIDAIPKDSIVFKNSEKLGIPEEFIYSAWIEFKNYWLESKPNGKKADWLKTFNNAIKKDGYGCFKKNREGEWYLTQLGKNNLELGDAA